MKIMEILWQEGSAEYTSVEDATIYLIRFGEKTALIDAVYGSTHGSLAIIKYARHDHKICTCVVNAKNVK